MSVGAYCRRPPCTVAAGEGLREAAARMEKEGVGLLVVTDPEGQPDGVLTDRDLALAASRPDVRRVAEVLTRPAVVVTDDAALEDAIALMRKRRIRRLPVVDARDRLVGVVSLDDLALLLAREIGGLCEVLVAQLPAGGSRPLGREASGATPSRITEHHLGPVVEAPLDASVRRLPVMDADGHLRGMFSLADLAEAAARTHGEPEGAVEAAEVGAMLEAVCRPRSRLVAR